MITLIQQLLQPISQPTMKPANVAGNGVARRGLLTPLAYNEWMACNDIAQAPAA